MRCDLGLIGLGTMGKALARNLASHGMRVSLWNRTYERIINFVDEFGADSFYAPKDFKDFINNLKAPRKIIIMLPAGEPTQVMLNRLTDMLDEGDAVLDGANQYFRDSQAYQEMMDKKGINLLGCGISGGEEGALLGPSIMPGGSKKAWLLFEEILTSIAAKDFNGQACVSYMGKGGAGHYVKMVHNGIEYGEMQALAEVFAILQGFYGCRYDEIANIFEEWNQGPLSSFLLEVSIDVLRKKEEGKHILDLILDSAAQKGTGRWTAEESLSLGVPTPSIAGSVFMRAFSTDKVLREKLAGHFKEQHFKEDRYSSSLDIKDAILYLQHALISTRIANFEQGFALLKEADKTYQFGLNFSEIVRIWQGGCIIRADILKDIHQFLQPGWKSLYFSDFAFKILKEAHFGWKKIVEFTVQNSIPSLSLSGALTHFEASRQSRGSAYFIQGLRDRFGAHGYKRIDKEGIFHSDW